MLLSAQVWSLMAIMKLIIFMMMIKKIAKEKLLDPAVACIAGTEWVLLSLLFFVKWRNERQRRKITSCAGESLALFLSIQQQ